MIFFGNSKIKEVSLGGSRIKEIYSGAELVWQHNPYRVEANPARDLNLLSFRPKGFNRGPMAKQMIAQNAGFYEFSTEGAGGRLLLHENGVELLNAPLIAGGGVRFFISTRYLIEFSFFTDQAKPLALTAKPAEGVDSRRSVVLDYASDYMIEDNGWDTATPSGTNRGVTLKPGRYWLTSNKGLYINRKWVGSPGGWVDFDSSTTTHIQLYYSGTRAYLVPGQTL